MLVSAEAFCPNYPLEASSADQSTEARPAPPASPQSIHFGSDFYPRYRGGGTVCRPWLCRHIPAFAAGSTHPVGTLQAPACDVGSAYLRKRAVLTLSQRRPLTLGVDEGEDPHSVSVDLVDQSIAAVRRQFTGPSYFARVAKHRKIDELGDSATNQAVNSGRSTCIACKKIIPDVGAILSCLRRPPNLHALSTIRARRFAKSVSTSSSL